MVINNEDDLGDALNNNDDTIEIEGDLAKKVFKIKATGKAAWAIAIAAIGVAVALALPSGGTSGIIGAGAITVLGLPAATSAVAIAVAAGGIGALNKLRRYKVIERNDNLLILKRS
jgi:hypothetical protein